ncbi:unnamed protein product [Citrullus colocynthis]|uniref:Uncharacterized protein n=1 Tax=Citrullus colocynthis TaxID=252529 RepID=A0ABP0Z256_9ROSI
MAFDLNWQAFSEKRKPSASSGCLPLLGFGNLSNSAHVGSEMVASIVLFASFFALQCSGWSGESPGQGQRAETQRRQRQKSLKDPHTHPHGFLTPPKILSFSPSTQLNSINLLKLFFADALNFAKWGVLFTAPSSPSFLNLLTLRTLHHFPLTANFWAFITVLTTRSDNTLFSFPYVYLICALPLLALPFL